MDRTRYVDHLTDADLALLARVGGLGGDDALRLRNHPELVEHLVGLPGAYELVFDARPGTDPLSRASPFLVFAVLVHRCARDLQGSTFVAEWAGPRRRLPVFDAATLRDFLAEPDHRYFLAELLASYTHVSSGAFLVRDRRGLRRRRFNELDPLALASLLDVVPAAQRPAVFRRLGDLMLLLTGVFPDRTGGWALSPVGVERLERIGTGDAPADDDEDAVEPGPLATLERLGRRFYGIAARAAPARSAEILQAVTERFSQARRVLNLVTDRYLFPFRASWFA